MKRRLIFIVCVSIMFLLWTPGKAKENYAMEIKFGIGNNKMYVNGTSQVIQSPYVSDKNVVFVPLYPVLEAYGAELNSLGKGKLYLVYRDITVDMTVGVKKYTVNDVKKEFTAVPVMKKNTVMVPVQFIVSNFGGKLIYDKNKKLYSIVLEDDGAISDFSAIIGSIGKPKVGNSYFKWSIKVPNGSQFVNRSFSSRDISMENQQRGLAIKVSVSMDEGKNLETLLDELKKSSSSFSSLGKIIDSSINTKAKPAYAEAIISTYPMGASIKRIYISKGYVYDVTVSRDDEAVAGRLKENTLVMGVVNSFSLEYNNGKKDIYDTSKVVNNRIKYKNEVLGISLEVLPEWDLMKNQYSSQLDDYFNVKLGLSSKEYVSILPESVGKVKDLEEYLNKLKGEYEANYNSKYYKFIGESKHSISDLELNQLKYTLQYGKNKYMILENYFISNDVLYKVILKCPEEKYMSNEKKYQGILESLKYDPVISTEGLKSLIDSREGIGDTDRVGKNDDITDYESNEYKWKISLHGNWINATEYEDSPTTMFIHDKIQSFIGVDVVKNNATNRNLEDEVKFKILLAAVEEKDKVKLVEKKILEEKGTAVRMYEYRYEQDEEEVYTDMCFYILDSDEYSYCFYTMIDDINATEKNTKELEDIWNSFTITK